MNPAQLYKQSTAPVERRVEDLLGRMTVREKIAQLTGFWIPAPARLRESGEMFAPEYYRDRFPDGIGSIGPSNISLEDDVRYRNAVQKFLREETRLGIPAIFHDEGCHGLMKPGATSFPSPLGLACSWDPALLREIYDVVAQEMRVRGAQHALTPVIDVARDPRWGRIDETYGEDPYLNSRLGASAVTGLQGSSDGTVDGNHVMATLKHFAGHGTPEGGLNCSPSICGPRELREVHLAPFAHVIRTSHPASVMPSYNEVDGIPSHASTWLLDTVLRGELGFRGLVVSDYYGVMRLHAGHQVAANKADAARLAFRAGVQLELPEPYGYPFLEQCLQEGTIAIEQIDQAVAALLAWKFRLGLFENPFSDLAAAAAAIRAPRHRALALRAAEESIVLLKNEGVLLPLSTDRHKTIAVIGPNADVVRLGGYSGGPLTSVSILNGIRTRVGTHAKVVHAQGCVLVKNEPATAYDRWKFEEVALATDDENRELIAEARRVAREADIVILVVGETESLCREAYSTKVVGDTTTLEFPGSQPALIEAVLSAGKPVVVYLMNGRPLAIDDLSARVPAILEGWYMGQETGTAAARILFGDISPSGKLTVSFPKSVGHIPAYYSKKPYSGPFPYIFSNNLATYPFGHGLSYATFAYARPRLAATEINPGGETVASIEVTNTGDRTADEIVQMYLHGEISLLTRPVKELKGFRRISLKPGETKKVEFPVTTETLAVWNAEMRYRVEPGVYRIIMGSSSAAEDGVALRVRQH
jgi:beta-glucosidase